MKAVANIEVCLEGEVEPELVDTIEKRLFESLGTKSPANGYSELAVLARDGDGNLIGALLGSTAYGWLLVKMLWVEDGTRRSGIGSRLMKMAENEAIRRGCHAAWLDTSSEFGRAFYEALGYRSFGAIENGPGEWPEGHRRDFLCKRLRKAIM